MKAEKIEKSLGKSESAGPNESTGYAPSHTRGPWYQNGLAIRSLFAATNHQLIVRLYNGDEIPHEEVQANARLIAAAPELLAALQEAVELLGDEGWDNEIGKGDDRPMVRFRNVIAKATGSAQ